MSQKPVIFVSAVSRELQSARQTVVHILEGSGIAAEFQEIFGAQAGDLRGILREKIDRCHGIIHLIGQQYGFQPPTIEDPLDPYSYTQYEARYGLRKKLNVWFLILDTSYPPDNPTADDEDKARLQHAWPARIRGLGHLYENIVDIKDLKILALEIAQKVNATLGPMADSESAIAQRLAKIEQALAELSRARNDAAQAAPEEDEATRAARAYEVLEKKLGLAEGTLAAELPRLAEKLARDPSTSPLERARALYAEKKYAAAEAAALDAKAAALAGPGFSREDALVALELAGDCAREQIHYDGAIDHFRAAAVLSDRSRDPVEWARIQWRIGWVLRLQGKYQQASEVYCPALEESRKARGDEDLEVLRLRNNLAIVLRNQGNYTEAEGEHRAVLAIRERVLGAEHPDTLSSRNNLANVLDDQGKYAEAEGEHRVVLAIWVRVLGAEHPNTLKSRNNLATTLQGQGKHAEAEGEHRVVLETRERVLGAEHPEVFGSCHNLALALEDQGKLPEALGFSRRAYEGWKKVLGEEHPDTRDAKGALKQIEEKLKKELGGG